MARALGLHTWDGRDSSLLSPQLKEASLDVPVFTTELVTWARNNPGEVLRIEQRLDGFLRSKTAPSLAFKPMRAEYRALLHDIAKYYGLNSHEYDPEPERYVNVVKSADSHAPSILLSSAAKDSTFVLSPHVQDFQRPSFYLGMLYPAAGMTLALLMQKLTLHIFDQRLSPFFSSPDLSSSGACIEKISMQGASTIVVDFSSFEAALETYLSLIEVKAYTGRPAAAVSGALATNTSALMNLRFLDLFEIEPGFRLDGYMPIQSGALSIGAVEDAWGDNDTEEAGQPVAHDSGEHSSAVLLDNRNVSQVSSANEHYLDWQFRVGGNVSVAYAVESNEELKEDDGDWETVTVQHAFASTREVECAYGESMAEDESRRPSRNVENNGIDGVAGLIANSGIVVPEITHSEYRPLNLLPRTLPPPLPPLPAPKTLKKNKVEDTKLQERDFPNRGAPQEERKLSNQFDSFVIDSDSDSDQEEKLNEDVLNASNAQVESQNNGVSWTCMRCTFANDYISGYGICMMCETPRF